MATPGIEQLFDLQRLPKDGFLLLLFLLYAPVGLCLMLLRLFIGVHVFLVSCALPDSLVRRFVVRVMCSVMGVFVKQNDSSLRDKNVKVYVCNHVTQFDHNVINLLTSCNTPVLDVSPGFVCWARGFMEFGLTSSRSERAESLKQYCSVQGSLPLLLYPEEETTNGKTGLLKFSSWPFSVSDSVQPVALSVKRPFIPANVEESSWILELLWTLFIPFTVYQVRWLPTVSRQDGDSSQEFGNKVQELLAVKLGVVSTQITRADKAEHLKRKRHIAPHTINSNQSLGARPRTISLGFMASNSMMEDMRISGMVQQVKEVLPHVPLGVIKRDLVQTNCVDTTIANLLEGAEEMNSGSSGGSSVAAIQTSSLNAIGATASAPALKPAAESFGRSTADRHMSLQDRKEALYEYARRRYIEKHGLNQQTHNTQ
ncbi:lipid droplet-regulating VLDL assembly factor AUP1-like [Acipenser ruthenus]|uniref:lipid droplet-regulating VLDL assembly factor AUP1-like n=1 Tax=Acipenser ruthenus TaxID=7906 RepID=UPI00145C00E6|nr:lipid droplet-regulating VLDL assembly factor AUP1-like [Acipenser ruthenus]